jgi:hypothetical protein
MQHLQAYRASIIGAMAAAAILVFAHLASAQARSPAGLINGGTEVQMPSAPIATVHRYRAAQWLLDMLPEATSNAENDEFVDGDATIFLSIFWITYVPMVVLILWLIGEWLIRRLRKLLASFSSFNSPHDQAELRIAKSNGGLSVRNRNRYPPGALQSQAHLKTTHV